MHKPDELQCPICASALTRSGREFSLEELMSLWKPIIFSRETIEEHKKQSEYTQLYVCANCQFETFFPKIIGTPAFYIALQEDTADKYYVEEKWDFEEAIKDVQSATSVIEIGCGPGVFLEKARQAGGRVVGVEYNQRALEIARNKGLTVYEANDPNQEQLKDQFDIAFSFHVLEHVPDPVAFVEDMLKWVKPGGKIGLSVPNMDGPVQYINPCVSNMPPHHATRWKLKTFVALSEKLGLRVERFGYEPLAERDYYYYSNYAVSHWLSKVLPERLLQLVQRLTAYFFKLIFRILALVDKQTISSLKGQSIYVLLSKPESRR